MKNKRNLAFILNLIMQNKNLLIINIALASITFGIYIYVPMLEQKIIDDGFLDKNFEKMANLVIVSLVFVVILHSINYLQARIENRLVVKGRENLKVEALHHGLRLKLGHLKERGLYAMITDANYDIANIMEVFSSDFINLIVEIIKVVGYGVGLFLLNWKMTIIVLLIIPIKLLLSHTIGKAKTKKMEELIEIQKEISLWQSDIYPGVSEIKNWNLHNIIEEKYRNLTHDREKISNDLDRISAINLLSKSVLEKIIFSVLYVFAGVLIINDNLTLGTFVAFTTYATSFFYPVDIIANIKMYLAEIMPSVESYQSYMELKEEVDQGTEFIKQEKVEIEFRDVDFNYEDNESTLRGINFKIKSGEKVAFIGKNGSGKSTIANLLLRYYKPMNGEIIFNGMPIENIELSNYRNQFAVMNQTVFLFNETIMDNITMYDKNRKMQLTNDEKKLLDFVNEYPEKYHTMVGLNGSNLSGGEKQRIALARTLNKRARILLLDEATSNCDNKTENIMKNILRNSSDDIVICITHNLSQIEDFDRIYLLDQGQIVREGSYKEVCDFYESEGEV